MICNLFMGFGPEWRAHRRLAAKLAPNRQITVNQAYPNDCEFLNKQRK